MTTQLVISRQSATSLNVMNQPVELQLSNLEQGISEVESVVYFSIRSFLLFQGRGGGRATVAFHTNSWWIWSVQESIQLTNIDGTFRTGICCYFDSKTDLKQEMLPLLGLVICPNSTKMCPTLKSKIKFSISGNELQQQKVLTLKQLSLLLQNKPQGFLDIENLIL